MLCLWDTLEHFLKVQNLPGMVAHICNLSTQEAEMGGMQRVPEQPVLQV